jgi:hypothetical protein
MAGSVNKVILVGREIDPFVFQRFLGSCAHGGKSECWEWHGIVNSNGYARFSFKDKHVLAHRFSFELFVSAIPAGFVVCHSCDNRLCVNPHHLWLGTQADNLADAVAKGRMFRPDTRAEKNGNKKLTWKKVRAIREMAASGAKNHLIAKSFGVSNGTIGNVVNFETWKEAKECKS